MYSRDVIDDDTLVSLYRSGMSTGEIADTHGVAARGLLGRLRRLGEPIRSKKEAAELRYIRGRANGGSGERWTCEQCGKKFTRHSSGGKPIRFCSQPCYHAWQKANDGYRGYPKGHVPFVKGTKGFLKRNSGTFSKGNVPHTKYEIGDVQIRIHRGVERAWVKVADDGNVKDWKLRAVVVWEDCFGEIASGMLVHHKGRDTLNDCIDNLIAMTRAEHLLEHKHEFEEKRRQRAASGIRKRYSRTSEGVL